MSEEIDNPKTLTEWLIRLKKYEADIFIREMKDGRWGSVALSELSPEKWGEYVGRWLEENRLPVRIIREAQPECTSKNAEDNNGGPDAA